MEAEQDPKSDHGAHIDQTEIDGTPEQPVRKRRRKALSCVDCKRRKLKCDRIYPACGRCVRGGNPQSCRYTTQRREREVHSGDDQDGGVDVADSPCTMQRETIVAQPIKDGALSSLQVLMQSQQETISRLEARIAGLEKLVNLTTSSNVQSGISGRLSAYDPKPFDRLAGAHLPISDPPENRSSESLPPYHPKPNRLVWDNPGPLVPDWILFRGKAGFKVKFYGPTFAGHMVTQVGSGLFMILAKYHVLLVDILTRVIAVY
ncbi:putative c6 zinc finger domain containing protein [Phaeomoniella chlamydospora]|uniref:Putative c6 zinc finger domain containing protein n=1 Tax=Phaeomoniella chlamydospora TaxID=158046 RepID=A0A0G2HIF8_PHACM|nr:putative c6 zinc finger domain containing protein [Phaeomoniella chlamydospora]